LFGIVQVDPRLSNAARRNSGVGSSQTACRGRLSSGPTRRGSEARQQTETLGQDRRIRRQGEQIVEHQIKPLTLEAVERLQHHLRWAVHPPLVHVHRHELLQQRRGARIGTGDVLREWLRVVEPQAMVGGQLPGHG
jgi:hypothetical protein